MIGGGKRANVLCKFVEPAERVAESAATRKLLISDVGPEILRLQLQSSLWFRPNLACSFRRETLTYLMANKRNPKPLLNNMLLSLEIRSQWRKAALGYSQERIRSRLCNRNGPIRQQGFDTENKPIVWILRALESRVRDWSSDQMQEEYARSVLWAVDSAIQRRPAGVHCVVIYVLDDVETPKLNFGKTFSSVFCKEAPAFLGLISCIRFFNPSKSSTILFHLFRHYSKDFLDLCRSTLRGEKTLSTWVSNAEQIPKINGAQRNDESDSNLSAHLTDSVDARLGLGTPFSLADIFNTPTGDAESDTDTDASRLKRYRSKDCPLFRSSGVISNDAKGRGRSTDAGLAVDSHHADWNLNRQNRKRRSDLTVSSLDTITETPSCDNEDDW